MPGCVSQRWQPVIGDPTWEGWATVLIYLMAAVLAWRVARGCGFPPATRRRERIFWMMTALIMAALAINKQLDLQSAITAAGRCLAVAQGWYGQRQLLQLGFLVAVAGLAAVFLAGLVLLLRGSGRRSAPAVLGLVFVCLFVLMRAASFHHLDRLLGLPVSGLRINTLLEWTGPLLISLGAIRLFRLSRQDSPPFRSLDES